MDPCQKEKAWLGTHHLPCFSPQDLHHLGHQQLFPPRAGPSGPGGPRRSPTRRQPQPVPQRHFNGNCWLGGQTREWQVPGRVWGSDMGSDLVPGYCQVCEWVQSSGTLGLSITHETCHPSDTHKEKVNSFGLWGFYLWGRGTSKESLICLKNILTWSLMYFISKLC